jgi:hypothetical protein
MFPRYGEAIQNDGGGSGDGEVLQSIGDGEDIIVVAAARDNIRMIDIALNAALINTAYKIPSTSSFM